MTNREKFNEVFPDCKDAGIYAPWWDNCETYIEFPPTEGKSKFPNFIILEDWFAAEYTGTGND